MIFAARAAQTSGLLSALMSISTRAERLSWRSSRRKLTGLFHADRLAAKAKGPRDWPARILA